MDTIGSILERYQKAKSEEKPAPHEKAAAVNEIISLLGESKAYDYKYWLVRVGSASYSTVLGIVKAAKDMPREMRGGYITNQLKPYAVKKPRKKKDARPTDSK